MGTRCPRKRWVWELGAILFSLACLAQHAAAQANPVVEPASVPASGRQEAILTLGEFGRYAVSVKSSQGTALQVIDRLAGPGQLLGVPGKADGRVDLFLDRGTYKVVTRAHEHGSGSADLSVRRFVEQNAPLPPLLVELKPVESTLDDYEQRSYWIDIRERQKVYLEAAGRNLHDLRLWSNGDWLVDIAPRCSVSQPLPGRPLQICQLTADLAPGLYLLSAYGGVPQPWSERGEQHPFHLRLGVPRRAAVARTRLVVSPFGVDRWIVGANANYFRVEVPEATPLDLGVRPLSDDYFAPPSSTAHIDKNSLVPVAEIELSGGLVMLTVTGRAGQPYVLQHFNRGKPYACGGRYWPLHNSGDHWISTIHSGDPSDSIDATAIVYRQWRQDGQAHDAPLDAQVIELGQTASWARRANLTEPLSVFVHITETGKYEIHSRGVKARFRLEPFFIFPPNEYEAPERQASPSTWDLEPGYYVLSGEPDKAGIIDVAVRGAAATGDPFARLSGKDRVEELRQLRPATQFSTVSLVYPYSHSLFVNQQPDVKVGMVIRHLPLDPTEPLPVVLRPGEQVSVPISLNEASTLRADGEDGAALPFAVDDSAPLAQHDLEKGQYRVSIRHDGDAPVFLALRADPVRLQTATALPPLPDPSRAVPPKLPVLTAAAEQHFDIAHASTVSYLVRAEEPALYRLQSTGLLYTAGNLRTRTNPSFDRQVGNGVGRNFYIGQYLREGDYQISVTAQESSYGHLGLTLERATLIDAGTIASGAPGRIALGAGEAVRYRFEVAEAGDYRVRSIGVGGTFRGRLEDADGWPIEPPNAPLDITRHFDPGTYQVISLPEPVASRRMTVLERIASAETLVGHGPHVLPLDRSVEHLWREPADGAERAPDVWLFDLPATIDATLDLTNEMQGRLVDHASGTVIADVPPTRGWSGRLERGRYRLEVSCSRINDKQPYRLGLQSTQIVAGLDRPVTPPASVPLSVGRSGVVQLSSFGSLDLRARLFDTQDRLLASSDDGPEDWNFQIQARLEPGFYRLQVDAGGAAPPVVIGATPTPGSQTETGTETETESDSEFEGEREAESAEAEAEARAAAEAESEKVLPTPPAIVSMRSPQEVTRAPLALPAHIVAETGDAIALYPLQRDGREELLLVSLRATDSVGCALEASDGDTRWRVVSSVVGRASRLAVPLAPQGEYRLRVWSLDGRRSEVTLQAVTVTPRRAKEAELQKGVGLAAVSKFEPPTGVARLDLDRPGLFRLGSGHAVRTTTRVDMAAEEAANGVVNANAATVWLVGDLAKPGVQRRVRGMRIPLRAGADRALQVQLSGTTPAVCDFAKSKSSDITLAIARSMAGQPGVGIVDLDTRNQITADGRAMAAAPASAVAVGLGAKRPAATIWQAMPGDPIDVRLHQLSFAAPRVEKAALGAWGDALTGIAPRRFELPAGAKRIRLSLPSATVAALSNDNDVISVHWNGDHAFEETFDSEARLLTLIHTSAAADPFQIEILPLRVSDTLRPLVAAHPLERAVAQTGFLRLPIAPGSSGVLHVRGASADSQLIRADGSIALGVELPLNATSGIVRIPHRPGLLLAWIDGPDSIANWGPAPAAVQQVTAIPAMVPLSGSMLSVRVAPPAPVMLHVRSATPLISFFQPDNGAAQIDAHAHGARIDAYLAAPAQLSFRALGGSSLWGTAEITSSPITPIGEGLGPSVLLAAGSSRLFSFEVKHDGPVGFGVRADPDVIASRLLDASGSELAHGVVNMQTLKAGTYLLELRAPDDSGPVRAQPAVAGIKRPGTGPPEDVVRQYLTIARQAASMDSQR